MKNICLVILFFFSPLLANAQEAPSWNFGLYSGYIVPQDYEAVEINSGFPIGVIAGYQFIEKARVDLIYQRLKTEHSGGDETLFQSFRLKPSMIFFQKDRLNLEGAVGFGYSFLKLENIDDLRQVEFMAGPQATWRLWKDLKLRSDVQYVRNFIGLSESLSGQFEFTLGLSYGFSQKKMFEKKVYPDSDQDGVFDNKDQCPTTAFGVTVASNGCPGDQDSDTIADYIDYCPDTKNGVKIDEMGCPLDHPARGYIDNIEFEKHSPRLTVNSRNELFRVAQNLKFFPKLSFVVEGYSSADEDQSAISISKARATTVMNVLISYGIPANKITAVGLGDAYPIASSKGSSLNERIEIKWKQDLNSDR
jgi:OOP family OmpA-OmpF porin